MKKFNTPELNVKEFSRVSILTDSATTNVEKAKAALMDANVKANDIKTITL